MRKEWMPMLVADFQGIYQQHANMWNVFNSSIKVLLTVASLPLIVTGILVQQLGVERFDFTNIPTVLIAVFALAPMLGSIVATVVTHYRLDILFYARALNAYRKQYVDACNLSVENDLKLSVCPMPTDAAIPKYYEPFGPMGWIVRGSAVINGLYFAFAVWSAFSGFPSARWLAATIAGCMYWGTMELWYRYNASKYPM